MVSKYWDTPRVFLALSSSGRPAPASFCVRVPHGSYDEPQSIGLLEDVLLGNHFVHVSYSGY